MGIRHKGYDYYGLEQSQAKQIILFCSSPDFRYSDVLMECAKQSNKTIAEPLYNSIRYNKSYEKLCGQDYIFYSKNDFYAYRRKCIYLFWEQIQKGHTSLQAV